MDFMYFLNQHGFNVILVEILQSTGKQEVLCILEFILSSEAPRLSPNSVFSIVQN